MSLTSILLLADVNADRVAMCRDFNGVIHVIYYDKTAGAARYYTSANNLKSLSNLLSTVAQLTTDYIAMYVDVWNNVFMLTQQYGAQAPAGRIHGFKLDRDTNTWQWAGAMTNVEVDVPFGSGINYSINYILNNRYSVAYTRQADTTTKVVYYQENDNFIAGNGYAVAPSESTDHRDPRMCINGVGTTVIFYRVDVGGGVYNLRAVQRANTGGVVFGPPVTASDTGQNVGAVGTAAVRPTFETASCLYFVFSGARLDCWLAEQDETNPLVFNHSRVWNGNDNPDWSTDARLHYDSRGSVYVTGVHEVLGSTPGGTKEVHRWRMERARGSTVWIPEQWGGNSPGDPSFPPTSFSSRAEDLLNTRPNEFYQGNVMVGFLWPAGAPATQKDLYYMNLDEYPGSFGYPTIWNNISGGPPPRKKEEYDPEALITIPIEQEGTALETYPFVPSITYDTGVEDPVNEGTYEIGIRSGRPMFVSSRKGPVTIRNNLNDADIVQAFDFLEKRRKDGEPFNVPDTDGSTLIAVRLFQGQTLRKVKNDVGTWAISARGVEIIP